MAEIGLARSLAGAHLSPSHVIAAYRTTRIDPPFLPLMSPGYVGRRAARTIASQCREGLVLGTYRPCRGYRLCRLRSRSYREATLLSPHDAALYTFLTGRARSNIERGMCPSDTVFGPRGATTVLRWCSFERSVLEPSARHVVLADVEDAGSSISHHVLAQSLRDLGCSGVVVDALCELLGAVMGGDIGLPTGYDSTDVLMTATLNRVDHTMRDRVKRYARCVDDLRMAVDSPDEAHDALDVLEGSLTKIGLKLHPGKSRVLSVDDYRRMIQGSTGGLDRVWELISRLADGKVLFSGLGSRTRWAVRWLSTGERQRARAASLLGSADAAPAPSGGGPLSDETAHRAALVDAVAVLFTARDPRALGLLGPLLRREPALTPFLARYLSWGLTTTARSEALDAVAVAMAGDRELCEPQLAWVFRAIEPAATDLPPGALAMVRDAAHSEEVGWAARVEAARLLSRREEWGKAQLDRMALSAPGPFTWELASLAAGDLNRSWSAGHGFI